MEKKATILLVDDEERILRSLKMLFMRKYEVLTTTDPHEAIELARQQTIHVIISDQRMPQMLGAELLREIKQVSPRTMRLLLTGYSDLNAIISSINEGEIFRFINKPWDQADILATVETAVQIALQTESQAVTEAVADENTPNLVVIDHDAETHEMIREAIGNKANIISHTSLEEGLETLSQLNTAMLITDLHINNEDISSTIQALRQQNPQLITMVLTSFQDSHRLIDMINHGQVFRFIPKPARRGLLSQCFDSALKQHQSFIQDPALIQRQKPAAEAQPRQGLSARLKAYLQRIQQRQQLNA